MFLFVLSFVPFAETRQKLTSFAPTSHEFLVYIVSLQRFLSLFFGQSIVERQQFSFSFDGRICFNCPQVIFSGIMDPFTLYLLHLHGIQPLPSLTYTLSDVGNWVFIYLCFWVWKKVMLLILNYQQT
jgi:hypothetical protein